jgi:hypothetical protein
MVSGQAAGIAWAAQVYSHVRCLDALALAMDAPDRLAELGDHGRHPHSERSVPTGAPERGRTLSPAVAATVTRIPKMDP